MTVHITLFAWFTCGLAFYLSGLVSGLWVRRVPNTPQRARGPTLPPPRELAITLTGDKSLEELVQQCLPGRSDTQA
jgi:hypothetical protein